MSARNRLAGLAAGLVVLAGLLGWLVAGNDRGAQRSLASQSSAAVPANSSAGLASLSVASAGALQRESLPSGTVQGAALPAEFDREHELFGIVLDPSERAVAGASVALHRTVLGDAAYLDLENRTRRVASLTTTSASDGTFRLRVAPGVPFDLEVESAGFATAFEPSRYAGERVVVRLQPAATLLGRVTREQGGGPIANALVRLWQPAREVRVREEARTTRTDPDGRWRLAGLRAGGWMLEIVPEVESTSGWIALALALGTTLERDVVLGPGNEIHGRVTDALTGAPISGAEVGEGWTLRRTTRTDSSGAYVLRGFARNEHYEVVARAPGYGRLERLAQQLGATSVRVELDFALLPARAARGRIVDPAGAPLEEAYVAGGATTWDEEGVQQVDWCTTRSAADGTFRLEDLRADLHHTLIVRRSGYGMAVLEFPPTEIDHSSIDLGDVVIAPGALVRGEVVDESDVGVADVPVALVGTGRDRERFGSPANVDLDSYVARRDARTDDLGRFAFADVSPGDYRVFTDLVPDDEPGPNGHGNVVHVEPGETEVHVCIVVSRGLALEGTVVDERGEPVPAAEVYAESATGSHARSARAVADSTGSFRLDGLQSGPYDLTAFPAEPGSGGPNERLLLRAELPAIEAGARGVRIVVQDAAWIGGIVLGEDGLPRADAQVSVTPLGDPLADFFADASTDELGRFRVLVPAHQSFDVDVSWNPPDAGPRRIPEGTPPTLPQARLGNVSAGSTDLVLRLVRSR
jgi:protocatechuate 3,4-dioxygenase beta subunit